MQVINRLLNGKLNLDMDNLRTPPGDYIDALNITRANKEIVYNINGNTLVANPHLSTIGVNKRIGDFSDITRNRIYAFIWNSQGYHLICYYDVATDSFVKLIKSKTDSNNIDILKFDPSYHINHIDIIYRDEGDLISWTDGNVAPREFDVTKITTYGTIEESFIEAAKRPPLSTPSAIYANDTARNNNSLRKVLPKFRYRWQRDDFTYTTYSPTSELALPVIYGTDNDLDPTKNNVINVTVETGNKNVIAIEIIAQQLNGGVWSDYFLVAHLKKADLGISDNGIYQFAFYNDAVYPAVDLDEVLLPYDYVPKKAYTQVLANGNTKVYGAITEGYNFIKRSELDVTMTVANVKNIGVDVGMAALSYVVAIPGVSTTIWRFTVSGRVPTGTFYSVTVRLASGTIITLCTYTSAVGNTTTNVASALYTNAGVTYQSNYFGSNYFDIQVPTGSSVLSISVVEGSGGTEISTASVFNWNSKYRFGQIYMDEQGVIMGDVATYVSPIDTDDDYEINTANFELDAGIPKTPVISASINHNPPTGAKKWMWVITKNLTIDTFIYYITCDFQDPGDGYYYFCLQNIPYFKNINSKFNYGTATVTSNSRLRVLSSAPTGAYGTDYYTQDYEVLGVVDKVMTGGVPADIGSFIKVKKPISVPSPAYGVNMNVCLYEPVKRVDNDSLNAYYEIGPAYDTYEDSGILYHRGQIQDQTASQPATFKFTGGDIYYHSRTIYRKILAASVLSENYFVMDAHYNDFYSSAINGYGRPQIINVDAKETFNPTLVRFSREFQSGTNINDINRFYPLNFDEYDRSNGSIRKMFIEGRRLFVFQQFDTGVVPVLMQIVKDTSGNPLQANSDVLLNKIQYPYKGKYGIGDTPESFAYSRGAIYFFDSNRSIAVRISQDGATALNLVYKANAFFISKGAAFGKGLDNGIVPAGQVYLGNPTVYGEFETSNSKYILAFEEIKRYSDPNTLVFSQDAVTLSFNEVRSDMEGFESFLSYHPESICVINNLLVTFKSGQLWKHTSSVYGNFYGVQYDSYITPVFNDNINIKKTFETLGYEANQFWVANTTGNIKTSEINPQTGLQQVSQLIAADFEINEGLYYAALLRDANSGTDPQEALVNGDLLKGVWISIELRYSGSSYAFLYLPHVGYNVSPKNS